MRSARVGTVSRVIPNPDREVAVTDEQRDSISLQKRVVLRCNGEESYD
jgi:hypothetical protein